MIGGTTANNATLLDRPLNYVKVVGGTENETFIFTAPTKVGLRMELYNGSTTPAVSVRVYPPSGWKFNAFYPDDYIDLPPQRTLVATQAYGSLAASKVLAVQYLSHTP